MCFKLREGNLNCTCKLAHLCKRRQMETAKVKVQGMLDNPISNHAALLSLILYPSVVNGIVYEQKGHHI
jgi:hypothetical protein